VLDRCARDLHRVADAGAGLSPVPAAPDGREHLHASLAADDLQLLHGVRALEVAGDQQRRVALGLEVLGQLAGQGGLAGALQAGQHDDGRAGLGVRSSRVWPPRIATSSSFTILMTCCAG
jgi:hypothetical protein